MVKTAMIIYKWYSFESSINNHKNWLINWKTAGVTYIYEVHSFEVKILAIYTVIVVIKSSEMIMMLNIYAYIANI